jgi:hypothetical protein
MSAAGRRYLFAALCLLAQSGQLALAQTDIPQARKFDEFGDIQHSDLVARLDGLAIQLQNEPTAQAFLIVYRARRDLPGLSNRYALHMKDYLVKSRGLPAERISTVDGGVSSCLTQELWVVPAGATPAPRRDAYFGSYQDGAYKFDEHFYALQDTSEGGIYWSVAPDNLSVYLDAFAAALRKEPRSLAYLVAYESVGRDPAGTAGKMLKREKDFLVREYGIKASRIRTACGGYRKWRKMELWVVPPGEYAPSFAGCRSAASRRRR